MKKIILCIGIICLLSGCGEEEQTMICTRENTVNGLTSGTEYMVTYTGDDVTNVRITYNYNQDTHTDGIGTGTDGTTKDGIDEDINNDNTSDGVIEDNAENNGIVDGIVGDVTKDIIGGVYDTILDLSGLKDRHTNQMNNTDITGFTSSVEDNTNNSYKVVYNLDLTQISDNDISRFNVDRSYETLRENYTNQGLTCK